MFTISSLLYKVSLFADAIEFAFEGYENSEGQPQVMFEELINLSIMKEQAKAGKDAI